METCFIGKFYIFLTFVLVLLQTWDRTEASSNVDKKEARDQVLEMFLHGYNSYMKYAYPADELMPLSCIGRVRGEQPTRGDVDDALGKFSLTLIDTLDTLAVLGLIDEFEDAVERIIRDVTFDTDIVVSVFETNIRVLGGLLGGHIAAIDLRKHHNRISWYKDELLYMAKDLGYRLLPAFNTSTGVPYPRVNLRHGIGKDRTEKNTCTACAGSMLLEFSALSRLTGDPIFEEKARHVMHILWTKRQRTSNLVGTVINIHTGDWVRKDSGIGAGIDSYYEYLLKGYILLGDEGYYDRFTTHYDAIMTYINNGPNFIDVHMHRPHSRSKNFMDALFAFWPGLQVLFGDIAPAIATHEMLYQVTQRHNFLPEAFTPDYNVYWGQHPLRPEFVESTYYLYKATNDPHYLDVGKDVMDSLQSYARVPCGFAGIKDVRTGSHEDRMDSFVLAETFKYLYLLFSEPQDLVLPIADYLFTTEAHILPLTLAYYKLNDSSSHIDQSVSSSSRDPSAPILDRSCPMHHFHFPTGKGAADAIRKSLPKTEPAICPTPNANEDQLMTSVPRLKASEFVPGNTDHMRELTRMGIQLVTLEDGRVQLMHSASKAKSKSDAEEGMKFMQEIIEITKTQQSDSVEYHPRVVQVISPEGIKNVVLAAGPAQFGLNLETSGGIIGTLVQIDPFHGCTEPVNKDQLLGRVVMARRGNCMFIEKARMLEKYGAIGGIIMDNNHSSSSDTSTVFAMSGDGTDDINMAVVFLFYKEGKILTDALKSHSKVDVVMLHKAKSQAEVNILYAQLNGEDPSGNVNEQHALVGANIGGVSGASFYPATDESLEQSLVGRAVIREKKEENNIMGGGKPARMDSDRIVWTESGNKDGSSESGKNIEAPTSPGDSSIFVNMENHWSHEMDLLLSEVDLEREDLDVTHQDLQHRMETVLSKYMENGKSQMDDSGSSGSNNKGSINDDMPSSATESLVLGVAIAPEDLDRVMKEIHMEFMKLEIIQTAINKLNPIKDTTILNDDHDINMLKENKALLGSDNLSTERVVNKKNGASSTIPIEIPNNLHIILNEKVMPSSDSSDNILQNDKKTLVHTEKDQNLVKTETYIEKREENLASKENDKRYSSQDHSSVKEEL